MLDRISKDAENDASEKPEASPELESGSDLPGPIYIWFWKQARRVVIGVIGSTVLMIGIAMIVLPGPAMVVIPFGLAILATEFVWARDWLNYARRKIRELADRANLTASSGDTLHPFSTRERSTYSEPSSIANPADPPRGQPEAESRK